MNLVVFVGLPGAGKSTFFRARFAGTHAHVSKDLLRNNRRPQRRQLDLIRAALARGESVVVDNTNVTRAERAALIELGRAHGARIVGYFFESSARDCLARNALRTGRERVPDVAIFAMRKRLEPPTPDEGFDALYRVTIDADGGFDIALRYRRDDQSADNPSC